MFEFYGVRRVLVLRRSIEVQLFPWTGLRVLLTSGNTHTRARKISIVDRTRPWRDRYSVCYTRSHSNAGASSSQTRDELATKARLHEFVCKLLESSTGKLGKSSRRLDRDSRELAVDLSATSSWQSIWRNYSTRIPFLVYC
jgi:hypothetical protein